MRGLWEVIAGAPSTIDPEPVSTTLRRKIRMNWRTELGKKARQIFKKKMPANGSAVSGSQRSEDSPAKTREINGTRQRYGRLTRYARLAESQKQSHVAYLPAWMRSAGTSTWETLRKEKRSSTRYLGGWSEVCLMMWATASVTAAWKETPPASRPARFTRTSWPGWKVALMPK